MARKKMTEEQRAANRAQKTAKMRQKMRGIEHRLLGHLSPEPAPGTVFDPFAYLTCPGRFRDVRSFFRYRAARAGVGAGLPREMLRRRWGINGEILWLNAHGIGVIGRGGGQSMRTGHSKTARRIRGIMPDGIGPRHARRRASIRPGQSPPRSRWVWCGMIRSRPSMKSPGQPSLYRGARVAEGKPMGRWSGMEGKSDGG